MQQEINAIEGANCRMDRDPVVRDEITEVSPSIDSNGPSRQHDQVNRRVQNESPGYVPEGYPFHLFVRTFGASFSPQILVGVNLSILDDIFRA
jgi:hypothetical protein